MPGEPEKQSDWRGLGGQEPLKEARWMMAPEACRDPEAWSPPQRLPAACQDPLRGDGGPGGDCGAADVSPLEHERHWERHQELRAILEDAEHVGRNRWVNPTSEADSSDSPAERQPANRAETE